MEKVVKKIISESQDGLNGNVHIDRQSDNMPNLIMRNVAMAKKIMNTNISISEYYNAIIDRYADFNKSNRCICPMHHETEASFTLFPHTNSWCCFGACKKAGDIAKLHEAYLRHLLMSGDYGKYRSISKIPTNELSYYTALEEIGKIFNLNFPPIFENAKTVSEKVDISDVEEMFENSNKMKLNESDFEVSSKHIESIIESRIRRFKNVDFELYKYYIKKKDSIMSLGEIESVKCELLKNLQQEIYRIEV